MSQPWNPDNPTPSYSPEPNYEPAPYSAYEGFEQAPENQGSNGMAIATLVVGILSLLSVIIVFGPILLGPIGIILGIIALVKAKKYAGPGKRKGLAITGLVLSVLSLIASVAFIAWGINFVMDNPEVQRCSQIADSAEMQACFEEAFQTGSDS